LADKKEFFSGKVWFLRGKVGFFLKFDYLSQIYRNLTLGFLGFFLFLFFLEWQRWKSVMKLHEGPCKLNVAPCAAGSRV